MVLSTAYAYIDALASQFIYEKTKYEDHGEFRFPYKMIEDSDEEDQIDYVCNTVFDIDQLGYLCLKHNSLKETDISIETRVSICFDRLYAILMRVYFDKLVTKITIYYLNRPEMSSDFYQSFLDKQLTPFKANGNNNLYNFISIALRDLMSTYLEYFKNSLYVMSNTVSAMIIAYTDNASNMSYKDFLNTNPIAYELLEEKYSNDNENEEETENE